MKIRHSILSNFFLQKQTSLKEVFIDDGYIWKY